MRLIVLAAAGALVVGLAGPAAAQLRPLTSDNFANSYGDDRLAYQDGVVYDNDLVPGRGPNQPFLVEEQGGSGSRSTAGTAYAAPADRPRNSLQLIGPDGRLTTTTNSVRYTD